MIKKEELLNLIRQNIQKRGYHVTIVKSGIVPRFAYSIGLMEDFGFELVFAGGFYYSNNDMSRIFNVVVSNFLKKISKGDFVNNDDSFKGFSLIKIENSWIKKMLLGVFDYYKVKEINAFQIVPNSNYYTKEIPDMSDRDGLKLNPVWKWLSEPWSYPVQEDVQVATNLKALQGHKVTEVMRWEEEDWEMFAGSGPDVKKEDIRLVPIGTMIGLDISLLPSFYLKVGKGIWRDEENLVWNDWG